VKQRVIGIVKQLASAPPPLPQAAVGMMEQGHEAVKAGEYTQAFYCYEVAQALAPWWAEPYYSEAVVFECSVLRALSDGSL